VVDDALAANGNDSDDSAISADNHRKPRLIAVDTDSNSDSDSESVFDDVERKHDDNMCKLQPTDDRLLSSATDDDDDNNTGSQLTVCDVVDHLRRRVSELENQKSAMQLEVTSLVMLQINRANYAPSLEALQFSSTIHLTLILLFSCCWMNDVM
jgi:hypothetical protein